MVLGQSPEDPGALVRREGKGPTAAFPVGSRSILKNEGRTEMEISE